MSPRPPYEEIGRLLADARAAAGGPDGELSQEDAARAIGVSLTTYGRWERGARRPRGRHIDLVVKELGIERELLVEPAAPARPVPPDLEGAFYELRDKIDRLEQMVSLLLNAHAAGLGVDVSDPAEAFAAAVRSGLLQAPSERGRGGKGSPRAGRPSATRKSAGAAGPSR
jgi:transcriptional regulator with XRE-family HTH domain